MKTKLLIIIGVVLTASITASFLFLSSSDDSEPFIKSEYVKITGILNNWQPIDGPAYSLITNQSVNAQVSDSGIFLYGDVLQPYMKDETVIITGTLVPNYVEYMGYLGLRSYGGDPHTATILVDDIQIIEKGTFPLLKHEMNRNELSQVLDWCNNTSQVKYGFYNYSNETHSINTKTCEWKEHVTFPNTDNLCIPYIDKWVSGEEIRNQTHIFDADSCTWKIDQNYDTVNSKGCPQFCPKDDVTDKIDDVQEIIIDENKGGNDYGIQSNLDSIFEYTQLDENLDSVFRSCERWENARAVNFTSPDGTKFAMTTEGYGWNNSTHYIDNNICEFQSMKEHIEYSITRAILEYCNSENKASWDEPFEYWFANETHYIDADTCLWQSLDDDIALVLPDHWKIVYSDD